jgi:hypothetical protein
MAPEICTRPPPISPRITGAVTTSPRPFSLANVVARDVPENARALGIEREVHGGFLGLAVKTGLGVGEVFTRQQHLPLDDDGAAVAFEIPLRSKGDGTGSALGGQAVGAFVHQPQLQRGGAAEDVLGLRRVLHTGQLHHDAVDALLLDHWLGHAEFVDAVVQRGDVLLERLLLHAPRRFGRHGGQQAKVGCLRDLQVRELGADQVERSALGLGVASAQFDGLAVATDAAVPHALFPEQGAKIGGQHVEPALQCRSHVDLQHEVDAAAKVEAQVHRRGTE